MLPAVRTAVRSRLCTLNPLPAERPAIAADASDAVRSDSRFFQLWDMNAQKNWSTLKCGGGLYCLLCTSQTKQSKRRDAGDGPGQEAPCREAHTQEERAEGSF